MKTTQTFDPQVARENGLETGQRFVLIRDEWIEMVLREDNMFDLFVNGELTFTSTHGQVTNAAKRIANPDHSATANLNTFRSWVTPEGDRIGSFMPNGEAIGSAHQDTHLGGSNTPTDHVVGELCGSCFIVMPLVGGCPTCD
jgi:2',3'-cyclic-nucleotide 2'-phosphodiesterase (5'-nucleotidase family)